jgi:hypothetical protein
MSPHPRLFRGIGLVLLSALLAANYLTNFAGLAEKSTFHDWQRNGQARVLGRIAADRAGMDRDGANLGKIWPTARGTTDWTGLDSAEETYRIFAHPGAGEPFLFEHYHSQYGLHATAYSALSRHLGLDTLEKLQAVPAILTAIVVTLLSVAYLRIYGVGFGALFFATLACAPLFLTMARNLYWSPFLLLLPALAAAWLYRTPAGARRWGLLALVWATMLLKCLSNYEYITTVTLLACSAFLVGPLFADPVHGRPDYRWAGLVFATCVAAFVVAFLAHAASRGHGVLDGIRTIYVEDIARRTYGDASAYTGEAAESLRASPLDVLKIYLFDYPGRRTMLVPGKAFLAMIAFCIVGIGARFALRERLARRDAWMLGVFFAVPASWYVLAKGHSYTQTHINFVLWFIGFMPALILVTWNTAKTGLQLVWRRRRNGG